MSDELQAIISVLQPAKKLLIVTHRNPDADTLGSACALYGVLAPQEKQVSIFCIDAVPVSLQRMPHSSTVSIQPAVLEQTYDVVVAVDISDPVLVGPDQRWLQAAPLVLNIDHHATNRRFGSLQWIVPAASSVSEMIWTLAQAAGWPVDPDSATCLLHGIMGDTGIFTNRATSANALHTAAALLSAGARYGESIAAVSTAPTVATLALWGRAFARLRQQGEPRVCATFLRRQDFLECAAPEDSADGIANFMNRLGDCDISVVWREQSDNTVRVNLRTTKDTHDVAHIAQTFGGGGHTKAAGFSFPGRIESGPNGWQAIDSSGQPHPFCVAPERYLKKNN